MGSQNWTSSNILSTQKSSGHKICFHSIALSWKGWAPDAQLCMKNFASKELIIILSNYKWRWQFPKLLCQGTRKNIYDCWSLMLMSILDFKGNVESGVVDCLEIYKITESHKVNKLFVVLLKMSFPQTFRGRVLWVNSQLQNSASNLGSTKHRRESKEMYFHIDHKGKGMRWLVHPDSIVNWFPSHL